jgi:hypothetical protein
LLDGVLAEARGARPTLQPAEPARASWWTRFRQTMLVPAAALAGTAALVLFIARPDPELEEVTASSSAEPAPAAAKETADEAARPAAPEPELAPTASPPEPEAEPGAAPDPEPTEAPSTLAPQQQQQLGGKLDDLGTAKAEEKNSLQLGDALVPGWDLIDRADAARTADDCRSALADYQVATEDDDPAVRARAYAGIGLCQQAAGNTDEAETNFAKARAEDGAVGSLIDRETTKPYRSSTKKSSRSKRKPKSKANAEKLNPFSGD